MVKKVLTFALLMLVIFASGCFIIYEEFVASSDLAERLKVKDDHKFLNKLPPLNLDTEDGSYSFVVLTDTHLEDGKLNGLEKLPQVIKDNPKIKFAVILGDITNGSKKDYNAFVEIANELSDLGVPFYPVIGNHDVIGDGWEHWKDIIGTTKYRIDAADATLIIMDSANIYFGDEQMDWLEEQLKNTNRDVFVFTHVPLFAPGYLVQIQMKERGRMVSIMQDKVDVVFSGHTHVKHTQKTGGVEYVTVDCFRDSKRYAVVTVSNSGEVTLKPN